eukprot:TRINITY_DN4864_c0_g1_i2.p1 TRINITY_DN4864_c0_g1~~TRINITY_DN4864_c0_g1_i2.p1  ORF type:complete len:605 (+),score=74.63 TRINITY_DN4864_c0_g1_i2:38-1852(+)
MRRRRPRSMVSRIMGKFPLICFGLVWVYSVVHYVWLLRSERRGEVRVAEGEKRAQIATTWTTSNTLLVRDCSGSEKPQQLIDLARKLWITNAVVFPSCEFLLDGIPEPTFNVILSITPLLSKSQVQAANLPAASLISNGKLLSSKTDSGYLIDFTTPSGIAYIRQRMESSISRFGSPAVFCEPGDHVLLGKHTERSSNGVTSHEAYSLSYYQTVLDLGRELLGRESYNFGIVMIGATSFGSYTDVWPIPAEPGTLSLLLFQSDEGESVIHSSTAVLTALFLSSRGGYTFVGYPWGLRSSNQNPTKPTHPLLAASLPSFVTVADGPSLMQSFEALDSDTIFSSEFHGELSVYLHSSSSSDLPIVIPVTPLQSNLDTVSDDQSFFLGKDILVCPSTLDGKKYRVDCEIPSNEGDWTFYDSNIGAVLQAGTGSKDWLTNSVLREELKRINSDGRPLVLKRLGVGIPLLTLPGGGSPGLWGQYGVAAPDNGRILTIVWDSPTPVCSSAVVGGSLRDSLQLNYTDDGSRIVLKVSPSPSPLVIVLRKLTQPPPYTVSQFASNALPFIELSSLWDIHARAGTSNPSYVTVEDALIVTVPSSPRGITLVLK